MKSRFDQTEAIRERMIAKAAKQDRKIKTVLKKETRKKVLKREAKLADPNSAASKAKRAIDEDAQSKLDGLYYSGEGKYKIQQEELLVALRKRSKDKLHNIADEVTAVLLFANLEVVSTMSGYLSSKALNINDTSEAKRMLDAIKGATREILVALKSLGISAENRKEQPGEDGVMKILSELDLSKIIPKEIQGEFLIAQEDMRHTSGDLTDGEKVEQAEILMEIKQPIVFGETKKDEDVAVEVFNPSEGEVG